MLVNWRVLLQQQLLWCIELALDIIARKEGKDTGLTCKFFMAKICT